MKKLMAAILAVCLLLATSGCGYGQTNTKAGTKNSYYAIFQAKNSYEMNLDRKMEAAKAIFLYNLSSLGMTSATVTRKGARSLRIEIPNVENPDELIDKIGGSIRLEFLDPDGKVILMGPYIIDASPVRKNNAYAVKVKLDNAMPDTFAQTIEELKDKAISISINDKIISTSNITSPLSKGVFYVGGSFTQAEAKQLSIQLKSGMLPPEMEMVESGPIK